MLMYRYRPDWPPGSNAALLAKQVRSGAGCSHKGTSAPAFLPAGFGKCVAATPAPAPEPPRRTRANDLLDILEGIGRRGEMIPTNADLLGRLGLSLLSVANLTRMIAGLEIDGLIRRRVVGRRRWIDLFRLGLVISNTAPPAPIGEAG